MIFCHGSYLCKVCSALLATSTHAYRYIHTCSKHLQTDSSLQLRLLSVLQYLEGVSAMALFGIVSMLPAAGGPEDFASAKPGWHGCL